MARQLRIEFENAFYHITSRGNLRDKIFYDAQDRKRFLKILRRTKERYGFVLHAYALMDNHYHLLLETPKANLSLIMQNINTSYTVYVNRKYQRSGHLLQGRFKGIIVNKDEYLLAVSRYIHLNPVRAGVAQGPGDYQWTSYRDIIEQQTEKSLVDAGDTLSCFAKRRQKAISAYRKFVEGDIDRKDNPFDKLEAGLVLGGNAFKIKLRKLMQTIKIDDELPQAKRFHENISIDAVIDACASYYGDCREKLVRSGKGKQRRDMAIYLTKVLSGGTGKGIGRYFGIKGSAVSEVIKRIETRLDKEKHLRKEVEFLKKIIFEN